MTLAPTITVAIPFYNAERYLSDAIKSVLNQTFENWELLLIDDGSTDNSLSIAKKFESSKVKIFSDGLNKGLISRLNQSVEQANGEFYARMDADDIMHPMRLEKELDFLTCHKDIDVVGTSYYSIDYANNVLRKVDIGGYVKKSDIRFLHPSVMAKTEWFRNNKYSESALRMEDYELWLRTFSHSKLYSLKDCLMYYREFGVPTFRKYLLTQKGILKLYLNYHSYGLSFGEALNKVLMTCTKVVVSSFLCSIGKADLLVKMRKVRTDDINVNAINDLLTAIK